MIFILLLPAVTLAGWQRAKVVVTGTWGNSPGQFDIFHGESGDFFPNIFFVDKFGNIIIPDDGNHRINIYNKYGRLNKMLTKPAELPAEDDTVWPHKGILSYEGGNSIVIPCRHEKIPQGLQPLKLCFIDYDGKILAEVPYMYVVPIENGYILRTKDRSYHYSPTGKMLEERPATLINRSYLEDEYGGFSEYKDDKRLAKCQKEIKSFNISQNHLAEYGVPVVTSNCDIYVWKSTPNAYSILKWTWVDELKKNR
jgi:hypothetical protein